MKLYKLMVTVSVIIRNFYLPNPFEEMQNGFFINAAMEPLLHTFTFGVVGLFYQSRTLPAWGSFLYLFFYWIHIGLLQLCGRFGFSLWADIPILIGYVAVLIYLKTFSCRSL